VNLINKIIDHLGDPVMLAALCVMAVVGIGGLVWIIMTLRKGSSPKEPKPKKVKPPKVKKQKKNKAAEIAAAVEISPQADIDEELLDIEPDLDDMEPDIFADFEESELSEIAADIEDAHKVVPVVENKKRKPKKVKEPKAKKVKPPKVKKVKSPKPKKLKKVKPKKAKLGNHVPEAELLAETDYKALIERIERIGKKLRSVLFGGAGIESLPLTIPVNIAIELSKRGEMCLLIDLDLKRDAIAAAFDIEEDKKPTDFTPKPFDTSFENLKVWPAFNFTKRRYVSVRSLVDAAVNKYDYVLINAPYLDGNVDRSQIGLAAACAFIFTQDEKQTARMYKLLESCNCKIMGNIQISS
jgi:hypothetical protein